MATIIPKNGGFLARVRLKGFRPVAKAFDKKADAQHWAQGVELAMRSGRYTPAIGTDCDSDSERGGAPLTVQQGLRAYRAAVGDKLKGADTYAYWFDELEASKLAPLALCDVSPFDVAAWRDGQAAALKASTVVRKLGLLSGFFSWAVKEKGWIARNPVASVRKPRVSDARDRTLSEAERQALLAAARAGRGGWLADALVVLLQSAMRRGELVGLHRADVDFGAATAHLADTKNGSARDVPLCPLALAALSRLDAAAAVRGAARLLPVAKPHAFTLAFRRTVARARRDYERRCAEAGEKPSAAFLADLRLHDCRHVAVSHWASSGALSVLHLQAISGHKTPRMLSRYAHLNASDLAARMAAIAAGAKHDG